MKSFIEVLVILIYFHLLQTLQGMAWVYSKQAEERGFVCEYRFCTNPKGDK